MPRPGSRTAPASTPSPSCASFASRLSHPFGWVPKDDQSVARSGYALGADTCLADRSRLGCGRGGSRIAREREAVPDQVCNVLKHADVIGTEHGPVDRPRQGVWHLRPNDPNPSRGGAYGEAGRGERRSHSKHHRPHADRGDPAWRGFGYREIDDGACEDLVACWDAKDSSADPGRLDQPALRIPSGHPDPGVRRWAPTPPEILIRLRGNSALDIAIWLGSPGPRVVRQGSLECPRRQHIQASAVQRFLAPGWR